MAGKHSGARAMMEQVVTTCPEHVCPEPVRKTKSWSTHARRALRDPSQRRRSAATAHGGGVHLPALLGRIA